MSQSTMMIIILILALIVAALVVIVILQIVKTNELKTRLDRFLTGQSGEDLEQTVLEKFTRIKVLEEKDAAEDKAIRDLYRLQRNAYQKSAVVKYDAYSDNGSGGLSFAFALLDADDNGVILNVMSSGDGSYCYLKEIENGRCDLNLGKEEAEALDIAKYAK